jgi:hypothetical protein
LLGITVGIWIGDVARFGFCIVCCTGAADVELGVGGGAAEGTCAPEAPTKRNPAAAAATIPCLCREYIAYLLCG